MKLNVKERLLLLGILPQEGHISQMVDVYELAKQLKLNDQEKGQISYVENGNYVKWDNDKDPNKDIELSSDQTKIIKEAIDELDKQGKVNIEIIPLIQKLNGLVQ